MTKTFIFSRDGAGGGERLGGGNDIRVTIIFTSSAVGADSVVYSKVDPPDANGLKLVSVGNKSIEGEIDEELLSINSLDIEIFDPQHVMYDFLFGANSRDVDKSGYVKIEIKPCDSLTWSQDFDGYIDVETISRPKKTQVVSFSVGPKTERLKNYALHDDEGYAYNPLGLYFASSTFQGHTLVLWSEVLLTDIILKCYQKVDPAVTLVVQHSWIFYGQNVNNPADIQEFSFSELKLGGPTSFGSNGIGKIFGHHNTFFGINHLSDLLKQLGFGFCFTTGMLDAKTAFVREIFHYDAGSVNTLGEVKSFEEGYEYQALDAVRITCRSYYKDLNDPDKYIEAPTNSKVAYTSLAGNQRGENLIDKELIFCTVGAGIYQDLWANRSGNTYSITGALAPQLGFSTYLWGVLQTAIYYGFRNGSQIPKIGNLVVKGIAYDYMKGIPYNGVGWQILNMDVDYVNNETTLKLIAITETTIAEPPDDVPKELPFTKVLPGSFNRTYAYNATLTHEDFGDPNTATYRTINIVEIPKETRLEEIRIKPAHAWLGLINFYITDEDPDPTKDIKNVCKLDYIQMEQTDSTVIPIDKDYEFRTTIKLYAEWVPASFTQGESKIIIKIMRKD